MDITQKKFREILQVSIDLSTEKNHDAIFELILQKAMDITSCDGGILYLYQDGLLHYKIMRIHSLHIDRGGVKGIINSPPVMMKEENICAYCAIHRKVINVKKISGCTEFDFSELNSIDERIGYRTQSMLVIPLENFDKELVGVLQLINAYEPDCKKVIAFRKCYEQIILSIASQAAVAVTNINFIHEIKSLLYSFVSAFATAVDQRTPYNGNHTRNVTRYTEEFVQYLNQQYKLSNYATQFSPGQKEQLVLAANLHDIGKLIVPLSVMNKSTRLGNHLQPMVDRYELLKAFFQLDYYRGRITQGQCCEECVYLDETKQLIERLNQSSSLSTQDEEAVRELKTHTYKKEDGSVIPYLEQDEFDCLLIKRGTLTEQERRIMESHVVLTSRILENIKFNSHYEKVPIWAGAHHEFLDGTGYPNHLSESEMPDEMRILTLVDVYDALTATDRPYKNPMPVDQALDILENMAEEGKLDQTLVALFAEYIRKSNNS